MGRKTEVSSYATDTESSSFSLWLLLAIFKRTQSDFSLEPHFLGVSKAHTTLSERTVKRIALPAGDDCQTT